MDAHHDRRVGEVRDAGHHSTDHRRGRVAAAVIVASATAAVVTRIRLTDWGATPEETIYRLPGDDLLAADSMSTRAITINAPRQEVWRWLVQIGQDRGGWYSYDWLENLFGLGIHSTVDLRDEWQHLAVDDVVRATPPGSMGMPDGYAFRVALVEPPHALVLRQQPPEHPWNATWAFVLVDTSPDTCRLLVRSRSKRSPGLGGRLSWLVGKLMDPVVLLMTRRMLLGIRDRSELTYA
jgi:hypothetical protein